MNERIKQLADKAGQLQLATPDNPSADAIMVLIGPNIEKFAELIVGECARVADQWVNDEDNGHNLVSERLRQHFGVES